MTKNDYLEQLNSKSIDKEIVEKAQEIYGNIFPEIIQKIISSGVESEFLDDDIRILSTDEIMEAEQDLHVDFKEKGLIPIADRGDNDFVVYSFEAKSWSVLNITDETQFKITSDLRDLL